MLPTAAPPNPNRGNRPGGSLPSRLSLASSGALRFTLLI